MLARINCSVVSGVDACFVEVEVDISYGLPVFNIVGLPETSVRESRERVKAAVKNSGYTFPMDRITVNLAPADIRKEGTGFDLPVAVGILAASDIISADFCARYSMVGELSLDGRVKPVAGVMAAALSAREKGLQGILVPRENGKEASVVQGLEILPVDSLTRAVNFFSGFETITPLTCDLAGILGEIHGDGGLDFCHVMGQNHVKRALEIAATGRHNLLIMSTV
ncbi:magnesium chelatase domain-containing protein [Desulfocicer niacini]